MAVEFNSGGVFTLDVGPALLNLQKVADASDAVANTVRNGSSAATRAYVDYSNALAAAQGEQRAAAAATRSAVDAVRELVAANRELEKSRSGTNSATAEYARITRELEKNKQKILEAKAAILESKQATIDEGKAVDALRESRRQEVNQTKLAASASKEAAQAVKESAAAGKDTGGSGGGFFGSLLGKLGPLAAGLFTVSKAVGFIKEGINDFRQLNGIENTFKALAGSAEGGRREVAFLREESNRLGLDLVPTAQAYTGLYAAAKEANLPIAVTRDLFTGLASAGTVLNKSSAEVESAIRAVEQMISKGTVSSQELKLQLGNALPGAFGLAAKAAGLTTQELGKQLAQGKILANDFLPKFAAQLKLTYGAGTADAAQAVGANLGRIDTFFQSQSAKAGAFFAPIIKGFADLVTASETAAQKSDRLVNNYTKQTDGLKQLEQTVTPLVSRYEELSATTNRNAGQQKELDSIIQQLAKTVPGAVTQFDAYGKALGINSVAVRQFVKDQENLVRYNNRDALKQNRAALIQLNNEAEELTKQLNNTVTGADGLKRRQVVDAASGGSGGASAFVRTLSQEESDKITNDLTAQLSRVQDDIRGNLDNRQILRGKPLLLPKLDIDEKTRQGLIAKQQAIIKDLQDRQKASVTTERKGKDGFDYLLGIGGLDEQLDAANKELDRLLGKVEKGRKGRQYSYEAQLKALLAERATLTELAQKAAIQTADDATQQAKASFEEQLRQVDIVKGKLEDRERALAVAARKAGGQRAVTSLGEKADGQIDGIQMEQINALRIAAFETYYDSVIRIAQEREQRLFDLRADSNRKEIEQVDRQYAELLTKARDEAERAAVERARLRAQEALRIEQEEKRLSRQRAAGDAAAEIVGQTFGAGTGTSKFEAERAEQAARLATERKFLEDSLALNRAKTGEQAKIEKDALGAQLLRVERQQRELDIQQKLSKFSLYHLILGENDDEKTRAALDQVAGQVVSSLSQIVDAEQQAAANRAQTATQNINELTGQLAAQIQLNQSGSASNIKGLQEQIAQERAIRRQALDDQRKAAKEKILIETLTQASSIATAAASVFAAFAPLGPFGVPLGIAAAGVLVTAFIASKVKAYEAASDIGKGFFQGGYTGGSDRRETRGVVHGKEFVHTAETTDKYRQILFEPLHKGRPQDIDWAAPQMQALLPTFAMPDFALPTQLQQERRAYVEHHLKVSMEPMKAELVGLRQELQEIKASNARMADRPERVSLGERSYVEITENGSTHVKNV